MVLANGLCHRSLRVYRFLRLRFHPLIVFLDQVHQAFHGFGFGEVEFGLFAGVVIEFDQSFSLR